MLELLPDEINEEWDKLGIPTLAYVFMDAASHINGSAQSNERLSQCVGLCLDVADTYDSPAIHASLKAMVRHKKKNPDLAEDQFMRPIFDALASAGLQGHEDAKTIATAAKDVQLPPANINKGPRRIILF